LPSFRSIDALHAHFRLADKETVAIDETRPSIDRTLDVHWRATSRYRRQNTQGD
jgi:hypothetical protein